MGNRFLRGILMKRPIVYGLGKWIWGFNFGFFVGNREDLIFFFFLKIGSVLL
jgi:hypothetical protein